MLPASFVHARQVVRQILQDPVVNGLAMALTATAGIPVFDFLKAIQGFGDQQCTPLVNGVALSAAEHHLRYPHADLVQTGQRIQLAQYSRPTKGCSQLR